MSIRRARVALVALGALVLPAAGGCNAIFGLDAPGDPTDDGLDSPTIDADLTDARGDDAVGLDSHTPDGVSPDAVGPVIDAPPDGGTVVDAHPDAAPDAAPSCANQGSEADEDGDGLPDRCDLCPWIPSTADADLDADGDHVGDACDPRMDMTHPDTLAFYNFKSASSAVTVGGAWTLSTAAGEYQLNGNGTGRSGTLTTTTQFGVTAKVQVLARLRVDTASLEQTTTAFGVTRTQAVSSITCETVPQADVLRLNGSTNGSVTTNGADDGGFVYKLSMNYDTNAVCSRDALTLNRLETVLEGSVGVKVTDFTGAISAEWLAVISAAN